METKKKLEDRENFQESSSTALKRNLRLTQKASQSLPIEYEELLEYSVGKKGIHDRCERLLKEYYHKYANQKVIIEHLVQVAVSDLWFYNSLAEREKAFDLILGIFSDLIQKKQRKTTQDRLVRTLITYISKLSEQRDFPEKTIYRGIELLKKIYEIDHYVLERNSTYLKNHLCVLSDLPEFSDKCLQLCLDVLKTEQERWLGLTRLEEWYEEKQDFFKNDYHKMIEASGRQWIVSEQLKREKVKSWADLKELSFFSETAQRYRNLINHFNSNQEKIYYILYLFRLDDMYQMRKNLLMDLNRIMRKMGREVKASELRKFTVDIFKLFNELKEKYRETVLDSILSLGKTIIAKKNRNLNRIFINHVIRLGFVSFKSYSLDKEWQVIVDRNHIKNIRIWLSLIELDPVGMRELLSALIINLRVGGIFLSDTDLFQKDISRFLKSDIQPIFKQVKQLARIFPIYYNKIGAEGELREITTAIDEIGRRQDKLLHFLRKQVHTESNNTNIELAREILVYWETGKIASEKVPEDIISSLDNEKEIFIHNHRLIKLLEEEYQCDIMGLVGINAKKLEKSISGYESIPEIYQKKVMYLIRIYNNLVEKYSFGVTDLHKTLIRSSFFKQEEIDLLLKNLREDKISEGLERLFGMMRKLVETIFSQEETEAREDIYYKRHVAAGIPSMYGQYSEPRFDALGLIFRLEQVAKELLDKLESNIQLKYLTHKTLKKVYNLLRLYEMGLEMDGINNPGFTSNLEMFQYSLESSFSLDQYLNIFQFLAESTKEIVKEYFYRIYEQPLKRILPQYTDSGSKRDRKVDTITEKFYRDLLTSAFMIQKLDNFIMTILKSIRDIVQLYKKPLLLNMLLSYEPDQIVSPLYKATPELDNPIFLGSKAYFLKVMHEKGLPIPPGFVLSTELFRHRPIVIMEGVLRSDILQMIRKQLDRLSKLTGTRYGDKDNPLLLSVRSGTAISMPGAMNTFLNVGMSDEIAESLSRQENMEWTAWDSYRRFLQSWGMAEGISRDDFDEIIKEYKDKFQIEKKLNFTGMQMKEIAFAYKQKILDSGKTFIEEPFLQLFSAIGYVLDSWDSKRALVYREQMQIANEWGTAVVVQKMVFGNMSEYSGTGVLFTHDPASKQSGVKLYGEYTVCSQGEDVVAGLVNVLPLSKHQAQKAGINPADSLEARLPEIYNKLYSIACKMIYEEGFSHQEIEFTFESNREEDLFILQTRNQDIRSEQDFQIFAGNREEMDFAGSGIGIGGGALNGLLVFDESDLSRYRKENPEKSLILVRPDTVPDDIGMIFQCDGLITGRGGATSHAAVTAVRLGIVCIVNCKQLEVDEENKTCRINEKELKSGDAVAIDGHFGSIYLGNYPVTTERGDYQG